MRLRSLLLSAGLVLAIAGGGRADWGSSGGIVEASDVGRAEVCFTTGKRTSVGADCAARVVQFIGNARHTLLVQAYTFTEARIGRAIVEARARGVDVTVIVDKEALAERNGDVAMIAAGGIPLYVDRIPTIAHNKVIVIDGELVLTGSLNFSNEANCCNAENLVALLSPTLARAYTENFERRKAVSERLQPRG